MALSNLDALKTLVVAWNEALMAAVAREAGDLPALALTPDVEHAVRNSVMNSLQGWGAANSVALTGLPLDDLFSGVADVESGWRLFAELAPLCDRELPDFVTVRLGRLGIPFVERLRAQVLAADWSAAGSADAETDGGTETDDGADGAETDGGDGTALYPAWLPMAIQLLGQWQDTDFYPALLAHFVSLEQMPYLLVDAVFGCGIALGDAALPAVQDAMRQLLSHRADHPAEYQTHNTLMYMLADFGRTARSAEIYALLRDYYRMMRQKSMGALALAQYGDPRAVTMLRRTALACAADGREQALYFETVSAIRQLGGQTADIPNPFRTGAKAPGRP